MLSFIDKTEKLELEKKLKEQQEELEKIQKQKDDFIWELGHDLKTPVTPLTTLLPVALQEEKNPEIKKILETTLKNARILQNKINKILERAKVKAFSTEFNFENIQLNKIINKAVNKLYFKFQDENIKIYNETDDDILVNADVNQMLRVFESLLTNILKYSKQATKVSIFAMQEGDFISVSVQDNGIGIDKQQLQNIFEEFYKTDESRTDLQSTGLGLSIAKQIIKRHDGEIFASTPGKGKGLTFYFTLKKAK